MTRLNLCIQDSLSYLISFHMTNMHISYLSVFNYHLPAGEAMQLIRKGGFRERANRHSRYEDSENKQKKLQPRHYANNDVLEAIQDQSETQNEYSECSTLHANTEIKDNFSVFTSIKKAL